MGSPQPSWKQHVGGIFAFAVLMLVQIGLAAPTLLNKAEMCTVDKLADVIYRGDCLTDKLVDLIIWAGANTLVIAAAMLFIASWLSLRTYRRRDTTHDDEPMTDRKFVDLTGASGALLALMLILSVVAGIRFFSG